MKILSSTQIREADKYTIEHEPIASIDLMERASEAFASWFMNKFIISEQSRILFLCGNGNNGGDGLAVARILSNHGYRVAVYIYAYLSNPSPDFITNLDRLPDSVESVLLDENMPVKIQGFSYIVDGLWGSGLI